MSTVEHYFENLLMYGTDKDNKRYLTEDQQDAVETCVNYVLYTLFYNREDFEKWLKERM